MVAFGSARLSNLSHDYHYKVLASTPGIDPPLREFTLYKVVDNKGHPSQIKSSEWGWSDKIKVGSRIDKVEGEELLFINGASYPSRLEDFFLNTLPSTLGLLLTFFGTIIYIRLAKTHS